MITKTTRIILAILASVVFFFVYVVLIQLVGGLLFVSIALIVDSEGVLSNELFLHDNAWVLGLIGLSSFAASGFIAWKKGKKTQKI